ncbi:MAG: DUF2267 domain-containing protein [Patescibacteria group bacterium]|jgi:uncharacterized protein (DUF2267 family)
MSTTGLDTFDRTVQQTNEILGKIEETFNWQGRRNQSYAALRTVIQTLRDRLPVKQAVNFGSQLPMLVKGIYYEGWDPDKVPMRMDEEEFLNRIRQEFPFSLREDVNIRDVTKIILTVIMNRISKGEVEDIKANLPEDVASLVER